MSHIYDYIELLGPRVLVRPLPELEFMADGLLVRPDATRATQNRAVVEKVGPGELVEGDHSVSGTYRAVPIHEGDLVFYQKFAGTFITLGERERLMLLEDEVQGRVPAAYVQLVAHTADQAADVERRVRALSPEGQGPTLSATEHLEGEPCLICRELETLALREAQAANAKRNIEAIREELRQGRSSTGSSSDNPSAGFSGAADSSSR